MSHIDQEYVKSSKEVTFENSEKRVCKCIYELHDGAYICIETVKVPEKREDGTSYNWKDKLESAKSYVCDVDGNAANEKEDLMAMLSKLDV
jgi:hypothetical protein